MSNTGSTNTRGGTQVPEYAVPVTHRVTHIIKSGESFNGDRRKKKNYMKGKRYIVIREMDIS
jgi:hypothetical protein